MTGWNLPPGCNERDLPGNRPEDQEAEAFYDSIYDQFDDTMSEELKDKLALWALNQVSEAYNKGYQQGAADAEMAIDEELKKLNIFR